MSALTIVAVVAVLAYLIGRQLLGEPIRGKRLITLPAVLTGIGILDLAKPAVPVAGSDVLLIVTGAVIAVVVGVAQGRMMRLQERDGGLWGQLPLAGLWLWALLYLSRGALIGVAHAAGAHVAAGAQAELLILGVNRLGQGASVLIRARAAGIPLAPEPGAATGGRSRAPAIARPLGDVATATAHARRDARRAGRRDGHRARRSRLR